MPILMFYQFLLAARTRKANEEMRFAQAIAILRSGSDKAIESFYQLYNRMTPEDYDFFFGKKEEEEIDFDE